ncbi:glyoxylase-like metal-dependent hydrolase (beta-lactamase superfamily II) [Neobacillus cucumis]|nr:glyoxylase-like metal-dependent hydrolase (beta-lactamase superfamily II) [Neobacillus cucumis]
MVQRRFQEEIWKNIRYVNEGDKISIGGSDYEVVHVPGHSQSDILLWNPVTGDAFAGDHLIKAFSVNAFIESPTMMGQSRPKPLLQSRLYRKSQRTAVNHHLSRPRRAIYPTY